MSCGGQAEGEPCLGLTLTPALSQQSIFIRVKFCGLAAWSLKSASRLDIHLVIASSTSLPRTSASVGTSSSPVPSGGQISLVEIGNNWWRASRHRCLPCQMRRVCFPGTDPKLQWVRRREIIRLLQKCEQYDLLSCKATNWSPCSYLETVFLDDIFIPLCAVF